MPELPEVETIRRDLVDQVLQKAISEVNVRKERLVRNDIETFTKILVKNHFTDIDRRGKLLIFSLANESQFLLWHLKMTGQIIYQQNEILAAGGHPYPPVDGELPNKHSHVIFHFEDSSQLFFNDQRQFGYLEIIGPQELAKVKDKYGPEPLKVEFTEKYFAKLLARRPKSFVKALLLDQGAIAGIGNIYADESLFIAKVRPNRRVKTLTKKEQRSLYNAVKKVLAEAIEYRGTTFQSFRDLRGDKGNYTDRLRVYGRKGETCPRCDKGIIKKVKVAGRGTHYCPNCQK